MKLKRYILTLALLVAFMNSAFAANQMIMYVEQDSPGKLVWCSLIKSGRKVHGSFTDFRGPDVGKRTNFKMKKKEFKEIWDYLQSPAVEQYEFVPTENDSMSEVGVYTVSTQNGGSKKNFRIPSDSNELEAQTFIKKMKELLN